MAKQNKTPKKASAKKQTPASKTPASAAEKSTKSKFLAEVPETYVFRCHDGQIFADLEDLIQGFDLMTEEIFAYHANDAKNDFSCWITDIIGDGDLAEDLKSAKNKSQAKEKAQQRYIELTQQEG
jgi:hypothetical protein